MTARAFSCTQYVNQWDYSGLNIGGKSYFNTPTHPHVAHRDSRDGVVAYEHTEFTSGPEIRQAAGNAGISLDYHYDTTFFPFADYRTGAVEELAGCQDASHVTVRHSANYQSSFDYSPADKVYRMLMYSARTGRFEAAVDELNGQQLAFENLLICFAPIAAYPGDSGDVQQVQYIAGGEAYLFTQGRGAALPVVQAGPRPSPGSERRRPDRPVQPRTHLPGCGGRGRAGLLCLQRLIGKDLHHEKVHSGPGGRLPGGSGPGGLFPDRAAAGRRRPEDRCHRSPRCPARCPPTAGC